MKKKIVFIVNNFVIGGVERFLRDVVFDFNKNEVEVIIISVWGSGVLVDQYQSMKVPIYFAGSSLAYNSKNPLLKTLFIIIAPITFLKLVWLIRKLQPDVVATALNQSDIIGIIAAWICRVNKRIIRQTDMKYPNFVVKWIKGWVMRRLATKIIANSISTKKFIQDCFAVSPEKIKIVADGIRVGEFINIKSCTLGHGKLATIGFLGRLEDIKGIRQFISSIEALRDNFSLFPPVLIFGDGSLQTELEKYCQIHQLNHIFFSGAVLNPVTALKKIDILVVPSISEGFGLVAIEGLWAGKAVVASDIPTFRDFINSGRNGYLIDANNPQTTAELLSQLLLDPQKIIDLQSGARKWRESFGKQYDISIVAQQYQKELVR